MNDEYYNTKDPFTDGNVVVEEGNASNVPLVSYTRGNDLSGSFQGAGGIGGLLARTTYGQELPGAPTTSFYHADGNGNVTALISPNGMVMAQYQFDPFGNLISKSGQMADVNKYRFSTKEWDDNAGLYYYGYRFYDPNSQRWLNRDPIQEWGGINLYDFVANNALFWFDLFGLCNNADSLTSANSVPGGGASPFCGMAENLINQLAQVNANAAAGYNYLNPSPLSGMQNEGPIDDLSGDLFVAATVAYDPLPVGLLGSAADGSVPRSFGAIENWFGPGYQKIADSGSDICLRSADGTRRIRFDLTDPHGLDPHIDIETFAPRNLYSGDARFTPINNLHVFPKSK